MIETKMKHVKLTHKDGDQVITGWVRETELNTGLDYRVYSEDSTNATKWALTVFKDHAAEWTAEEIKPSLVEILNGLSTGSVIKPRARVPFFKLEDKTWVGAHNRDTVYTAEAFVEMVGTFDDVEVLFERKLPVW